MFSKKIWRVTTIVLCFATILVFSLSGCTKTKEVEKTGLKWWQETLVYEIYPNSFKDSDGDGYGDLKGIISELDYLQDLGVGAIWLTPIYDSPMRDNGYDVSDYYKINPRYGTMEDMDELIKEAEKRDILIVMDLVFNHTSNNSEWFKESESEPKGEKGDWYIWADPVNGREPNNWRGIFGGNAWTYSESRGQYYLHTFADFQPDLNWENENVRQALFDVANFWADKGVGGFRLDAVTYIKKPEELIDGPVDGPDGLSSIHNMTANTPEILDFLHEFKDKVQKGREIFMVGEANGVPTEELNQWVGDNGVFDMIFEFSHVNIQFSEGEVWSKTKDWKLTELKQAFSNSQNETKEEGWCPVFLENHDQPRAVNHFLPKGADSIMGAKLLGMLNMTLRGTPFLFEGQELGMTNIKWNDINMYNDLSSHSQYKTALANGLSPDEAIKCVQRFSRDNARTPMQWSEEKNAGFTTGTPWLPVNDNYKTINAKLEKNKPDSVLSFFKDLMKLRREHRVLLDGNYNDILFDDESIFAYTRENEKEKVIILLNFTGDTVTYDETLVGTREVLMSNYGGFDPGYLRPYEGACLVVKK